MRFLHETNTSFLNIVKLKVENGIIIMDLSEGIK